VETSSKHRKRDLPTKPFRTEPREGSERANGHGVPCCLPWQLAVLGCSWFLCSAASAGWHKTFTHRETSCLSQPDFPVLLTSFSCLPVAHDPLRFAAALTVGWQAVSFCAAGGTVAGPGPGLLVRAPGMRKDGKERFCEDSGVRCTLCAFQKIWSNHSQANSSVAWGLVLTERREMSRNISVPSLASVHSCVT